MSWQTKTIVEQKERFIRMWLSHDFTVSGLCESFNISRTTGYNLIRKYKEEGEECFHFKSKRPKSSPFKTSPLIEEVIIELREKHKNWGARKFKIILEDYFEKSQIPSETTINAILKRNGLIKNRRSRTKSIGKQHPKFDPSECNEIWSADYKGRFKLNNGRYCKPLTVCDSKSRYILNISCHYNATYKAVKQAYTKVFKEYGKPEFMHTDNGSPFGNTQAIGRLTRLGYWLIDHEIIPVFSDPASPQQNGRHERMHRDLKAYCKGQIKSTLAKQQRIMDAFKEEYNSFRPHEALGMKKPSDVHKYSERKYRDKVIPYDYSFQSRKMKVCKNGAARWGAYHWVFVGNGAKGRYVAAQEVKDGVWNIYYRNVLLGYIKEKMFTRKEQYQKINKIEV